MKSDSSLLDFVKRHKCKQSVVRTFTRAQWEELVFRGNHFTEDETGKYRLEMRDCPHCHSTLGVEFRQTPNGEVPTIPEDV
jgi:hypothetical protein